MAKMTAKQKRFCDEYLIDLNATQAAIRAGYSKKTAYSIGIENLKKPELQKYIQKRQADRTERTEITQDFVLKELIAIATVNATDYLKVVEKQAKTIVDGTEIQLFDDKGKPVMYKAVEPVLTEELTEIQKKALDVIKCGRDGFVIKPYDKLKTLELIGKHLGMFDKKPEDATDETASDGFIEALQGEVAEVWEE